MYAGGGDDMAAGVAKFRCGVAWQQQRQIRQRGKYHISNSARRIMTGAIWCVMLTVNSAMAAW